jgi:hypothetical protein
MDKSTENKPPSRPADEVPWDGSLVIDPATVSRILESWTIFEELELKNALSKKANTQISKGE